MNEEQTIAQLDVVPYLARVPKQLPSHLVRLGDVGLALVAGQYVSVCLMIYRNRVLDGGNGRDVINALAIVFGFASPAWLGCAACTYALCRVGLRWRTAPALLGAIASAPFTLTTIYVVYILIFRQ